MAYIKKNCNNVNVVYNCAKNFMIILKSSYCLFTSNNQFVQMSTLVNTK